MTVAEAER